MNDYNYLKGKKISLVVRNSDDKKDIRVFPGKIIERDNEFHFINVSADWDVELDFDQLNRIKEVTERLKEMLLDADYFLPMTIGNVDDDSKEELRATGMTWNEE
jgi:hypothetical protein